MPNPAPPDKPPVKKRRSRWYRWLVLLLWLGGFFLAARLALSPLVHWYVNRALDENPLYEGKIGAVNIHLWRGAYTIHDIRLIKTTGNVPVPFFSSPRAALAPMSCAIS